MNVAETVCVVDDARSKCPPCISTEQLVDPLVRRHPCMVRIAPHIDEAHWVLAIELPDDPRRSEAIAHRPLQREPSRLIRRLHAPRNLLARETQLWPVLRKVGQPHGRAPVDGLPLLVDLLAASAVILHTWRRNRLAVVFQPELLRSTATCRAPASISISRAAPR